MHGDVQPDKRLMSVEKLCNALDIRRTKAFELIRDREVVSLKIGSRRLIRIASVDAYIERQQERESR